MPQCTRNLFSGWLNLSSASPTRIERIMRRLTGTETAALGVIHAIRRSNALIMPPIGWPVEIESETYTESKSIVEVIVGLPDLNMPGNVLARVTFKLMRTRVQGAQKYVYSVKDNQISIFGNLNNRDGRFTHTICHYVSNTYAHDDDFVVPVGTPQETEMELMQVSTRELRRWMSSHPLMLMSVRH